MLQFITNTNVSLPVADQIRGVIAGGGRWVQIRMKEASDEEIESIVNEVKPLCIENEVFLLLDDRVELAKRLDVGGVHLGLDDMPPSQARMKLGPAAVIGCTANSFDDIKSRTSLDIDYFGIGPFRHTLTKKNLAPILNIDGIKQIVNQARQAEVSQPLVAIGGIQPEDVKPLMMTGINGIAVSGAIAGATDVKAATENFIRLIGHP